VDTEAIETSAWHPCYQAVARERATPELIWDGKYDKDGKRAAPIRIALPFQTVETVNESAAERQRELDLFASQKVAGWRNRLIWGDQKYVLPALLNEFAGAVDLVYIDPPFATGQNFSRTVQIDGEEFVKEPSMIEVRAYRDTWGAGLDSYLSWIYGMGSNIHALLRETGSIYLHLDPGVSHLAKIVLDEIFGPSNFRNEITWKRTTAHSSANRFGPVHETLLFYTKSASYTWNKGFHDPVDGAKGHYKRVDEAGRHWEPGELTAPGVRRGETGEPWRGFNPTAMRRHWSRTPRELDAMDAEGRIYWPQKEGAWPRLIRYLDDMKGVAWQDIWTDIPPVNMVAHERAGYPTQKPIALLKRVISASSNAGDLVLDCVCGSGTTAVTSELLGRRWIAADIGRFAVHTTRKRLIDTAEVHPFAIQNLGKYERQLWQFAEFGEKAEERQRAYREFILTLYKAKPVSGYLWLHGIRHGHMVHVGNVDAPVTAGDIKQIAAEFRRAVGTGGEAPDVNSIDVLGWDFAFELNEVARQEAARANLQIRFLRIPREVLDKRAVEQGDIRFFELAALSLEIARAQRTVTISITQFVMPLDDVPEDVQRAITNWVQWIDYWAIDWEHKGDTFHNEWQSYRTRENRDLGTSATHSYSEPGSYEVVVKVIDILGNDTTKTLKLDIS
jgi:adenine-specific DNA-methyltransferase